ncbi:hypothetical protein [Streptomyces sp. NPDC050504]|uniref:hypothetical protein n=1 Tax=Streptomyces sp. NPDC050504 TaxID=3365618 RepID=UPI003788AE2A
MPTPHREPRQVLSMRDLLASCAAATAVSTPPRERAAAEAEASREAEARVERRDAA